MFKKKFQKTLNSKTKSDFSSLESKIIEEPIAPRKKVNLGILIPSIAGGACCLALAIVLPLTLAKGASPFEEAKPLTKPQKPFNQYAKSSDVNYLSSLVSFSSKFASIAAIEGKNYIASPLSIATAFSMAYEGADNETKDELASLLCYDDSFVPSEAIQNMLLATSVDVMGYGGNVKACYMNVSDAVFVDSLYAAKVKEDYLSLLQDYYFADAYEGQLKSPVMHETLASWINDKTNDFFHLTGDSFKELGGVMWLANAIYLKAIWSTDFNKDADQKDFHNEDGTNAKRTYLHSFLKTAKGYVNDSVCLFEVPLAGGIVTLRLLDALDGIDPFSGLTLAEQESYCVKALLDPANYLSENTETPSKIYNLSLTIPEFKETSTFDLKDLFEKTGLATKCFTPYVADFSRQALDAKADGLHISSATHEAGIDLNQDGIEAAAYTVLHYETESMENHELFKLTLDHPFHYSIVDAFGHPLFIGRIANFK